MHNYVCSDYDGFASYFCTNADTVTNYCIKNDKIHGLNGNSDNACVKGSEKQLEDEKLNI